MKGLGLLIYCAFQWSVASAALMPGAYVDEGSSFMPPYKGPAFSDSMREDAIISNLTSRMFSNFSSKVRDSAGPISKRAIAGGIELKVLPLGDSITHGMGSTHFNGYRGELHRMIEANRNPVRFIGTQRDGNMANNQHEGYPGATIDQISERGMQTAREQPNIILVHAGTNDMNGNVDVGNAPARLRNLIYRYAALAPTAAIIVAEIIPALDTSVQNRINVYNSYIPGIVANARADGKRVTTIPISQALSGELNNNGDFVDKLHPSNTGYTSMAIAWYIGIQQAAAEGHIERSSVGSGSCRSDPFWVEEGMIASGGNPVFGDGSYQANWISVGEVAVGNVCPGSEVRFIDLNGDGLKDYACIRSSSRVDVWINVAHPSIPGQVSYWWPFMNAAPGVGRDGAGVIWADINGDGKDDYCWVDHTGNVDLWINNWGKGQQDWIPLGNIAGGVGATRETIRLTDIDGDGRADYLIVHPTSGAVTAWLNGGSGDRPVWRPLGVIASGVAEGYKVTLGDFTGNGRADYMWINANGQVTGYTNNRREEAGLNPLWKPQGFIAVGVGVPREHVRLVDFDGDGKIDYLTVDPKSGATRLWLNHGTGGKYQAADGIFLCDLTGSGTQDYFYIDHYGRGWGYLNRLSQGKNHWTFEDIIHTDYDRPREDIRMAVMTRSGRADYLVVDRATGRTTMWQNDGRNSNGLWQWSSKGVVATGVLSDIGPSFDGRNVRFHDFNGDGLADYVYVAKNGVTTVWLHDGNIPPRWSSPKMAASGVGRAGRDIQFADLNGDSQVDYIYVDRITGSAEVWTNMGGVNNRWQPRGIQAVGVGSAGLSIKFADMYGNSRDAYLSVNPEAASIRMWNNMCRDPPPEIPSIPTLPKCDAQYTSLDAVERDKDRIPRHCMNLYLLKILRDVGKKGFEDYEKLLKDGYQKKFDLYSKYIRILAPGMMQAFMEKHASKYFTCYESRLQRCCSDCSRLVDCTGCGVAPACGKYYEHMMDRCPTSIPKDEAGAGRPNEVRYELKVKVEDFEKAVLEEAGLPPDWYGYGKLFIYVYKVGSTIAPDGCCPSCVDKSGCTLYYHSFPVVKPNLVVEDPKKIFEDGLPKMRQFIRNLDDHIKQIYDHTYPGNTGEVIEASQIPISLITQGIDGMNAMVEASSEVAEWLKKEQTALIVTMVTAFIGFVPWAGSVIRAAGFTAAGRAIAFIGDAAAAGLNMYSFQSDPTHGGNLMFVIIDIVSVYAPRFSSAATIFRNVRDTGRLDGMFNLAEATRMTRINMVYVKTFHFGIPS